MSKIRITIETNDRSIVDKLSEPMELDEIEVISQKIITQRTDYISYIFEAILQVSGSIAVGLLTNWIYDQLKKGKNVKLEINRREVNLNQDGQIERILEEEIRVIE